MQNRRLDDLFFRYCEKKITDEEREELMAMLLSDDNREQINGLIDQFIRNDGANHALSDETADDILSSIFSATGMRGTKLELGANQFFAVWGVLYQPRGSFSHIQAAGADIGGLQLVTGAMRMQGNGNLNLGILSDPIKRKVAALIR